MKTKPMRHQSECLKQSNGREFFAVLAEMGTGKTYITLADAERAYEGGQIDAMLVMAPKGVHTNWVRREIPEHMSVPYLAASYSSGMGKRAMAKVDTLFRRRENGEVMPLRILTINFDAVNSKAGMQLAMKFLNATRALMVVDESARIKNPSALRTKNVLRLGHHSVMRRILSGAPITKAPTDLFSQFEFLDSGLLGTTSYRSFVAEFADLLDADNGLMKHIIARTGNPHAAPQVVARNADGSPRWRNLDKLQSLIAPHSFRITKEECLDLPAKIYKQSFFSLSARQQSIYDQLEEELRIELDEGDITTVSSLAALVKLQQVTSCFVNIDSEPRLIDVDQNPRMDLLLDTIEDIPGKFIVWARFTEEIRQIAAKLTAAGVECVQYYGAISTKMREEAVDSFQKGTARAFIGQAQSGGIGLTLTAAEHVVYYSNDFDLGNRIQSEDRAHRIGTKRNVIYIDLVAEGTIDEPIAAALQRKKDLARTILDSKRLDFRSAFGQNATVPRKESAT